MIGINSQIESPNGGGNIGIGFAVPINTAQTVAEQLLDGGEVEHAFLGITGGDVTPEIADVLNLSVDHGAIVQDVVPDGPADDAGVEAGTTDVTIAGQQLRAGGDVITKVDGEEVTGMDDVIAAVNGKQPGDDVELTLVRKGDERTVTVELGDRPAQRKPLARATAYAQGRIYPWAYAGEVLWDHEGRGCAGGRAARRVGDRADPLRPTAPGWSSRRVAAEIGAELRRRVEVVGVFVNASLDALVRAAEDESLTMLQLHGDEGPAFCQEAARRTGCGVIKAMRVRSAADILAAEAYRTDYHLFDAYRADTPGGTGESFDWELLAGRSSAIPSILSGGLTPVNVAEAISVARARRPSTWPPASSPSPGSRTTS